MYICERCYYSGLPSGGADQSKQIKSGGISGFISSIFGSANKNSTCPKCEKESMVALSTNEGREILDSITK